MFAKVLVANRGEIAVRDLPHAARARVSASVAVYSDADRVALHAALADEAFALGGAPRPRATSSSRSCSTPRRGRAPRPSIPGYGFLAENAAFARAVEEAGLVWIGPPPAAIELMGSKTRARQAMQAAGVPIIPGTTEPVASAEEVRRARRARSATRC